MLLNMENSYTKSNMNKNSTVKWGIYVLTAKRKRFIMRKEIAFKKKAAFFELKVVRK